MRLFKMCFFIVGLLCILLYGCYKPKDYLQNCTTAFTGRNISFTYTPTSQYADANSVTMIIIKMPDAYDTVHSQLTVSSTRGVFAPSGLNQIVTNFTGVDGNGFRYDTIYLRAPANPGIDTITYNLNGCTHSDVYTWNRAYPDTLVPTAAPFYLTAGVTASSQISVLAIHGQGYASRNTVIQFDYVNPNIDKPVYSGTTVAYPGRFTFQAPAGNSSDSGIATCNIVYFDPDTINLNTYPLYIRVSSYNNDRQITISDTVAVYLTH